MKNNGQSSQEEADPDALDDPKKERARKNAQLRVINEGRLKELFAKFEIKKASYDQDCMDLCIPYAEVRTNIEYKELVKDEDKVNQLASILIRYKKMDHALLKDLCYVIQNIDAYDFTRLRDDKSDLRKLRNKVLGIPDGFIVTLEDIEARVEKATSKINIIAIADNDKT